MGKTFVSLLFNPKKVGVQSKKYFQSKKHHFNKKHMAQTYKTLMSQTSSVALQTEKIQHKICASCFTGVAIQNRHLRLK